MGEERESWREGKQKVIRNGRGRGRVREYKNKNKYKMGEEEGG
jgi:hypothetical protein